MDETAKLRLEKEYIPIESILCEDVLYCIRKDGQGMHILSGKQEMAIRSEFMAGFLREAAEVWDMYGTR